MAEIAVVGAGIVGLATAHALADRGVEVAVYERGRPGNGQSGGDSRIFRHLHADPRLVALARESRALWRAWERRWGRELLRADGLLCLAADLDEPAALLAAGGVAARRVQGDELRKVLPVLGPGAQDGEGLLDEEAGVLRTGAAIELLSRELADALVPDEVLALRPTDAGPVELRAGDGTREYERVIVCAGRGTAALARGAGLELPVAQSAHVRLAFAVAGSAPPRLACLLDRRGAFGERSAYADPLPGNELYAVGLDEAPVRADGALCEPDGLATIAARTQRYVARALPGLAPGPVQARHCWVTELPWAADGFAVWDVGGAAFFAGNNLFKHAPTVGRALAAHALGDTSGLSLRPEQRLGAPASMPAA
ncbi:MAG: FAD-binding oxidoreductase [Solirubrobacterales bacterium]|nr:FAD-binding oxidoreductase [Solirubrobacterales bacterium]